MGHLQFTACWMLVSLAWFGAAPQTGPSDQQTIDEAEIMIDDTKSQGTTEAEPDPVMQAELERVMQAEVVGDGPPLVLVGGGLTGWISWEPHAERLAATRTVARLQPLNVQYGLEDRPLPEDYSVRLEGAALIAALDSLGWDGPVDLVAWSYGSLVTLDAALSHPERVHTLTLIEPPAAWVLDDRGADDPVVQALHAMSRSDISETDLERFLRTVGLIPPGTEPEELPQWPVWMDHRQSLRMGAAPLVHGDDPARLRAFDRPVLLVTGTGTAPFHRRIQDVLAAQFPRAHHVEMPAGHAPHIVSMDRFLDELARFLEAASTSD